MLETGPVFGINQNEYDIDYVYNYKKVSIYEAENYHYTLAEGTGSYTEEGKSFSESFVSASLDMIFQASNGFLFSIEATPSKVVVNTGYGF